MAAAVGFEDVSGSACGGLSMGLYVVLRSRVHTVGDAMACRSALSHQLRFLKTQENILSFSRCCRGRVNGREAVTHIHFENRYDVTWPQTRGSSADDPGAGFGNVQCHKLTI